MADDKPSRLQPLFLVKPGTVTRADIRRAEKLGGICIIECADPESARYSEPPLEAQLDVQARACLSLLRMILRSPGVDFKRGDMTKFFIEALLNEGKPLMVTPVGPVKK